LDCSFASPAAAGADTATAASRGFDHAFEHFISAEKRDFLQLLVHEATITDAVSTSSRNGRYGSRYLDQFPTTASASAPATARVGGTTTNRPR